MKPLSEIEKNVKRKRLVYIIPLIFVLYIITFLDRVNISYATLTMSKDLNFTPAIFGLGAGIFFIGYFILEIPITTWVEKWSARKWLARIMIGWGIITVITAFMNNDSQFYALRFALGLGEAGFFPGLLVYMSNWFRIKERAFAYSIFIAAIPISQIIGAPLSTQILTVNWLHLEGWRWLFVLEGLPAIIMGIVAFFLLTDRPKQAKWLTQNESNWLQGELDKEKMFKVKTYGYSWKKAIRERDVIILCMTYFFWLIGFYGLGFFLPTIVSGLSKLSVTHVGYLVILPYLAACASLIMVAKSSDKRKERKFHAFTPLVLGGIALGLSILVYPNLALSLLLFVIATAGIYAAFGPFWSIPTLFLTETSAAVSIGLINSVGNLGGFVGPFVVGYLKSETGSFATGSAFMVSSIFIAAILLLLLKKTKSSIQNELSNDEKNS